MENKEIQAKYKLSKEAKVGTICICPSCGTEFKKESYQQAFCLTKPLTSCKDFYWNAVKPTRKDETVKPKYDNLYVFEEKCRRCGTVKEMYFSDRHQHPWQNFAMAMNEHLKIPQASDCDKCKRWTVKDVISYSGPQNT